MALSNQLKKVEEILSPPPGQKTGFITRDDLVKSFEETFTALSEVLALVPPPIPAQSGSVVAVLSEKTGKAETPLYEVLSDVGVLLERVSRIGPQPVTGDAAPTTVAKVAETVNSLVEALSSMGIVIDNRVQPPNMPTEITAPASGALVYTFVAGNAAKPVTLPDLAWLNANLANLVITGGTAVYTAGTTPAWNAQAYIVIAGGDKAHWNGNTFEDWNPPVSQYVLHGDVVTALPVEVHIPQTFAGIANLPAPTAPTDAALIAAWTNNQHLVLGDNTFVFWDGTNWAQGKAP